MYTYLLVLRILHIASGVFWAGAALFMAFYIAPAVLKAGPDGGKITQAIMSTNKLPTVMTLTSLITIVSGILLMWELSFGFTGSWFSTKYGTTLTIGSVTALLGFLQGFIINRPGAARMQSIGKGIAQRGGPPTPEEQNELLKIRTRIFLSTRWIAYLLIITIITMGMARYV
jgi:uncharacterized membrane protein